MGTAISTKTACLPPSPIKNTQYLQRCNYLIVYNIHTFATASLETPNYFEGKVNITKLKSNHLWSNLPASCEEWVAGDVNTSFCTPRVKANNNNLKQCPTRMKFMFFSHIYVYLRIPLYCVHHSTHLVPSSTPTQLSPTVMILSWSTGPRRNSEEKV